MRTSFEGWKTHKKNVQSVVQKGTTAAVDEYPQKLENFGDTNMTSKSSPAGCPTENDQVGDNHMTV